MKLELKPTRDGYGLGLVDAGSADKNVVVLCADLTESTRSLGFKKKFPDRFVQLGVSEQSMAAIAAGMALAGKIPFISSYAAFSPGRNWEQIRTNIALNNVPVKIAGAHAGVSVGPDGATHQALEDIATMRVVPNMTVIVPCDALEARKATVAAAKTKSPVYLRFAREASPVFTTPRSPFQIGRAEGLRKGRDAAIIGCGPILYQGLLAAEILAKEKIQCRVINCHTVKPLDEKTLVAAARECGAVVSLEEHQIAGGLGSAIAELLAKTNPVPQEFVGMQDRFGESGDPEKLAAYFGLTASFVVKAVRRALKKKALAS